MPNWPMTLAIVAFPALASGGSNLRYRDIQVTFVSADARTGTFTVSLDDGSSSTGRAVGDAVTMLKRLKPGDKLLVTCRDDASRQLAATAIKVVR